MPMMRQFGVYMAISIRADQTTVDLTDQKTLTTSLRKMGQQRFKWTLISELNMQPSFLYRSTRRFL
ncbi:Uncharacterised protein [Vibrio cholerae]|uniref:Uncharacterized protein n=1 Tax=Vibrio cholerae TaxID=666 RepID=A0A655UZ30_VIBCL|nr:Uncharacterised protein [Vibrio cholerae]CRZ77791.1 Uncharacterised protein [Vibrio cholerae]CSA04772.1 Uncharacterised protein [Vibrio cholerae]CSA15457.1 Uncharacterised protein [Vibrio cholerae]CSA18262.1 Uncharacterised protein [Vibrio cholerae]